jgi:hypothetical protein
MQVRTQHAWGIVSGTDLLPFTIRRTRDAAIGDFCNESGYDVPEGMDAWRWLKRRGNRCVKVALSFMA